MRTIIAGSRDGSMTKAQYAWLDEIKDTLPITEVVSGAQRGIDSCGESWAKLNGLPVKRFPAHWREFGRPAGPMRNKQMAEYADACILFQGGSGTSSMRGIARRLGLKVINAPRGTS